MLVRIIKLGGNLPLRRLVLSGILATSITTLLLYISVNHQNIINININETPKELSPLEIKKMDKIMSQRKTDLKRYCSIFELDRNGTVNAYEYLINEKYQLIWCNVFKVASSSWMYNFNIMAGYSEKEASEAKFPQMLARERYPRPSVEDLMNANLNSTSMLIVRDPFERLSSAYRDKMQSFPYTMYGDLAESIVKKYRQPNVKNPESHVFYTIWPTFEEFVRYIIDEYQQGRQLDIHWIPYTSFCTPCHFNFDFIMKFENLDIEQIYLIKKLGLGHIIKPEWKNSGEHKTENSGVSTADLVESHYSQLTMTQIMELYKIYRYDFLLFDYNPDKYFLMANVEEFETYSDENTNSKNDAGEINSNEVNAFLQLPI